MKNDTTSAALVNKLLDQQKTISRLETTIEKQGQKISCLVNGVWNGFRPPPLPEKKKLLAKIHWLQTELQTERRVYRRNQAATKRKFDKVPTLEGLAMEIELFAAAVQNWWEDRGEKMIP